MANLLKTQLETVHKNHWEQIGVFFGLLGCFSIAMQLFHEWRSDLPSSLSLFFVFGFVLVYLFWFLYGIRFNHLGVWFPNIIATVLQLILASKVVLKNVS